MSEWRRPDTLPDLRHVGRAAIDIETTDEWLQAERGSGWPVKAGHVVGVSAAYRANGEIRSDYYPIRHPDSDNFDADQIFAWLKDLLASGVRIIGHNLLYDFGWLLADGGIAMPQSEHLDDTGALATMVDENRFSYSLDNLCKDYGLLGKDETVLCEAVETYFGVTPGKNKNPPQAYVGRLPARFVAPYAGNDAAQTFALFEALYPTLAREGTDKAYRLEVALLPMVLQMRRRGIRIDTAAAERNRDLLLQKRDAVFVELAEKLGVDFVDMEDIGSPGWLAETCDRLDISYPRTPTGKPSFTAGTLGWMHRHPHWFPRLVVRADQFNNAAVNFLQRHVLGHVVNGRIHAEIHPHRSEENGTKSFRFSYSDPPLQQMPSHDEEIAPLIREVFLPDHDEVWASCDQNQQEFRLFVAEAAKHGLAGALEAAAQYRADRNTDFHAVTSKATGLDRPTAKRTNFAKLYRAGIAKFAATIGKSEAEAQAIYDRYDHELPFPRALADLVQKQVERDGFLTLYDNARRHFDAWEVRGVPWSKGAEPCGIEEAQRRSRNLSHPWFGQRPRRVGAYTAINPLIQGNAARQTKLWMLACWREGIAPLLQMHDALELSVATPEQADRVAQLGCEAITSLVPMQVDVKFGHTWGDAKHAWAEIPALIPSASVTTPYQPPPPRLASQLQLLHAPRTGKFPYLDEFVDMVAEREAIRERRANGQVYPWTNDDILGRWYFTNMSRAHDKHTIWLWDNWCRPHAGECDLWFAMVVARLINRITTWEALGYPVPWDPKHFIETMANRPKNKAYGGAYVIPAFKGDNRPKYLTQAEVFTRMWNDRETLRPRDGMLVAQFVQGLQPYPGIGQFLAWQIAADTKPFSALRSAPDFNTAAGSGPGSLIGINLLMGRSPNA
jgi:DNA polymerase I-like protein with 3'-5' exonuclease and polymerase domains